MRDEPTILPLHLDAVAFAVRGTILLDEVSLAFGPGTRSVILGPNGAGKSLLLRLCHGLLTPTAGRVRWGALAPAEARRQHAMVFQRPVLLRRSVLANIVHALALAGIPWRERRERARHALVRFGLAALAERPARLLSGGEQQRLAIARAWATAPRALLLDEPTAALDPSATRAIEVLIDSLAAEGLKIVMTTHDLGQARRLADDVAFLHRGRLHEHSPAAAFFASPRTAAGRAYLDGQLLWSDDQ